MAEEYKFKTMSGEYKNVKLGDTVYINGEEQKVTLELISSLPFLFQEIERGLDYYEDKLLKSSNIVLVQINSDNIDGTFSTNESDIWCWLKDNQPNLFYRKVLELIAEDANATKKQKECIYIILTQGEKKDEAVIRVMPSKYNVKSCCFYDIDDAKFAIQIMGDKIKYAI